jgi:hypothetical protein
MMSNVVSLWYLIAFSAGASYVARRDPRGDFIPGLHRGSVAPKQRPEPLTLRP